MANYVYTLVHDKAGNFLMFKKHVEAFFFGNAGGGQIYPTGHPLGNGPGMAALPGGKFENGRFDRRADIIKEAQREFIEECGRLITFEAQAGDDDIELGDPNTHEVIVEEHVIRFSTGSPRTKFACYYLQVEDIEEVRTIAHYIAEALNDANLATLSIQSQAITDYDGVGAAYPHAPYDNELATVSIWNYANSTALIDSLDGNSDTDWFYQIIRALDGVING